MLCLNNPGLITKILSICIFLLKFIFLNNLDDFDLESLGWYLCQGGENNSGGQPGGPSGHGPPGGPKGPYDHQVPLTQDQKRSKDRTQTLLDLHEMAERALYKNSALSIMTEEEKKDFIFQHKKNNLWDATMDIINESHPGKRPSQLLFYKALRERIKE